MRGLVTVNKVYSDGSRETIIDRQENTLTHGFGVVLADILTKGGEADLDDFRIGYLQIGTSSLFENANGDEDFQDGIRKNIYSLKAPLQNKNDYGIDTELEVVRRRCTTIQENFIQERDFIYQKENRWLVKTGYEPPPILNFDGVQQSGDGNTQFQNGVNFKFTLDEKSCSGLEIKEFGLYVRNNEEKTGSDEPILIAYKSVNADSPIVKTSEFSVEIQWTLEFFDTVKRDKAVRECIYFGHAIRQRINDSTNPINSKFLQAGDTYELTINAPGGTRTGGYLHYEIENTPDPHGRYVLATSGVHWAIVDDNGVATSAYDSPIYFAPGESYKSFLVSAIDSTSYHYPCFAKLNITNFTGDRKVPDAYEHEWPNSFVFNIRPSRKPLLMEFNQYSASADSDGYSNATNINITSQEAGTVVGKNIHAYIRIQHQGSYSIKYSGVTRTYGAGLPLNSSTDTSNYVRFHKIPIPEGLGDGSIFDFRIKNNEEQQQDFAVRFMNPSETRFEHNLYENSHDFRTSLAPKIKEGITVKDVIDNRDELALERDSKFFKKNFVGSRVWYDGFPTAHLNSGYDLYTNTPNQETFCSQVLLKTTESNVSEYNPDGIDFAQMSYNHPFLWCWPYSNNGNVKIFNLHSAKQRLSQNSSETDTAGGTTSGPDSLLRFQPHDETIVYSCYVKNLGGTVVTDKTRGIDVSSNNLAGMTVVVRGFPNTGFFGAQKSKKAFFEWNPTTSGLETLVVDAEDATGCIRYNDVKQVATDPAGTNPVQPPEQLYSYRIYYTSGAAGGTDYNNFYSDADYDKDVQIYDSDGNPMGLVLGKLRGDKPESTTEAVGVPNPRGFLYYRRSNNIPTNLQAQQDYYIGWDGVRKLKLNRVGGAYTASISKADDGYAFLDGLEGGFTSFDCGVLSGTNGGSRQRDIDKYGITDDFCRDGWYRMFMTIKIPREYLAYKNGNKRWPGTDWARVEVQYNNVETDDPDSKVQGAIPNRFLWASLGEGTRIWGTQGMKVSPGNVREGTNANDGSWYQVPGADLEYNRASNDPEDPGYNQKWLEAVPGCLFAWPQFEYYKRDTQNTADYPHNPGANENTGTLSPATGKFTGFDPWQNKYLPRPYQHRASGYWTPLGGIHAKAGQTETGEIFYPPTNLGSGEIKYSNEVGGGATGVESDYNDRTFTLNGTI